METEELIALGVYDPDAADAEGRLELIAFVTALGATAEELVTFKDTLPALAGVLAIRGGAPLTLEQVAQQSGLTPAEVRLLARTSGIPDPEPDVPIFTPGFVAFASHMAEVTGVFGEDATSQLIRVFGLAMSRIADAVISSFLVNVAPGCPARGSGRPRCGAGPMWMPALPPPLRRPRTRCTPPPAPDDRQALDDVGRGRDRLRERASWWWPSWTWSVRPSWVRSSR